MARASVLLLAACAPIHSVPDDPAPWFDPGATLDVAEALAFTDVPYDFTGPTGIADLPIPEPFAVVFEPGPLPTCPDWSTSSELPREIEGIVTIYPRLYYKTDGCDGDEEKYYGSFFVQDASGGIFVLGDSKVAHFDAGDRVHLTVRGLANRFDLPLISVHDVTAIDRGPEPIYYEIPNGPLDLPDVGLVRRVSGEVVTEKDTFGAFQVESDDGTRYDVSLDVELNRRGVDFPVGTRLTVTGPVLYSFSVFAIVIMQIGQVEVTVSGE
jgi:hypothetical protein